MKGITHFSVRRGGGSTVFCRLFYFSEYRKFRMGTSSVSLFSGIGKIYT